MGCCIQTGIEIKSYDIVLPEKNKHKGKVNDFVDVSLSSDENEDSKKVEEWISYKASNAKSLSDSLAMMSTLLHSDRKMSFYSKHGSLVDSFAVALPIHK